MAFARSLPQLWLSLASVGLLTLGCVQGRMLSACLDDKGNPVDWFIAYKFPRSSSAPPPYNTGFAYAYITSRSAQQMDWQTEPAEVADLGSIAYLSAFRAQLLSSLGNPILAPKEANRKRKQRQEYREEREEKVGNNPYWTISNRLINDPSSMVLRTLAVAYRHTQLNSIFYSDQPPKSNAMSSGARAHAKGALIMDQVGGIGAWLTHSMPYFPPPRDMELEFDSNAPLNGQTFMCVTFKLAQSGEQIINHLVNMHPLVYDSQVSGQLATLLPALDDISLEGEWGRRVKPNKEEGNLAQTITTPGGQRLQLFSKSAYFQQDIYADWIDRELNSNLYVASWRSGAGGKIRSYCPAREYHVNNVNDFKLETDGLKLTWTYRNDHSKWAISQNQESGTVCIGDINRMESQFKRGGGAVCIRCPQCWRAFSSTILDLDPCPVASKVKASAQQEEVRKERRHYPETEINYRLLARLKRDFL